MYIANPLNPDGHYSLRGPMVKDPIFTPLFTGFFSSALGFSATTAGALGIAASAIATTSFSAGILIR